MNCCNTILGVWLILCITQCSFAMEKVMVNTTGTASMDPAVMKVLDQVLQTLESIRNARIKDLNDVSKGLDHVASSARAEDVKLPGDGPNKKKPLITKTYGYKVTVYATPLNGSKQREPDLYGQASETDLQTAGSFPLPKYGVHGGHGARNHGGEHHRDHHAAIENGYDRGHHLNKGHLNAHEDEGYKHNGGGHHLDKADAGRDKAEYAHERGAQNERGLKEKTEIEYFEREQFKKEDLEKSTGGHGGESIKKGGQEHGHNQHGQQGAAFYPGAVPGTFHYGQNGVHGPYLTLQFAGEKGAGGGGGQHGGSGYVNKEAGGGHENHLKHKQGEGLKERGFKITVEREVYLKDQNKEAGYGRHDRAHQQKHNEGGHHHHEEGGKNKHVNKEYVEDSGHDSGYNHKIQQAAEGGLHHDALQDGYGNKKGAPHIIYDGDNYYSPSDSGNNTAKAVILPPPPRRRPQNRRPSSHRTLPRPDRGSVIPSEVSNVHYKDPRAYNDDTRQYKGSEGQPEVFVDGPVPRVNSRRPYKQPAVTVYNDATAPDDVVRSYIASQNQRKPDNVNINPILDSLTPPSAGKDRFAFEVPKIEENSRVIFPESTNVGNVAGVLPQQFGSAESAELNKPQENWNNRNFNGATYAQPYSQQQAPRPGVWYDGQPS